MAVLAEAGRVSRSLSAPLCLIHADEYTPEKEERFRSALRDLQLDSGSAIRFEPGEPAEAILKIQHEENIDLLVAGAMETESVHRNFTGDVARELLRRAPCDLLLYTEPSEEPKPPQRNADRSSGFIRTQSTCPLCGPQAGRAKRRSPNHDPARSNHLRRGKREGPRSQQWQPFSGTNARIMGPKSGSAGIGIGLSSTARKHRFYGLRIYPVQRNRPGRDALSDAFFGSVRLRAGARLDHSSHSRQPLGHPPDGRLSGDFFPAPQSRWSSDRQFFCRISLSTNGKIPP